MDPSVNSSCNGTLSVVDRYSNSLAGVDNHFTVKLQLDRSMVPIWLLLGIPGAAFSFIVWIHPKMRHSSGIFLGSLAIVDLSFLCLQIPWYLHQNWNIGTLNFPIICQLFPIVNLSLQYLSPLLTLGFTVERYISVCHPFKRERLCTTRRALIVTSILCFVSFMLGGVQGYFYTYNSEEGICTERDELFTSKRVKMFWTGWSWFCEMTMFAMVPFAILVCNIFVIRETRRMAQRDASGAVKNSATTVMLLSVSFLMIMATLPVTVMYVLFFHFENGDICMTDAEIVADGKWQRYFNFLTTRAFIDNFAICYYAAKFYIYLVTGKLFRQQFLELFCSRKRTRLNGRIPNGASSKKKEIVWLNAKEAEAV